MGSGLDSGPAEDRLDFLQDGMVRNGTLETRGFISTQMSITHPPMQVPGNSFPCGKNSTSIDNNGKPSLSAGHCY